MLRELVRTTLLILGATILLSTSVIWVSRRKNETPPSAWIVFSSNRSGGSNFYRMRLDGNGVTRLTRYPLSDWSAARSPDGKWIVFVLGHPGNYDIYRMRSDHSNLVQLTHDPSDSFFPDWSPDGQWITFMSNRSGNYDIYRIRADGSDLTRLTNDPANDSYPTWSSPMNVLYHPAFPFAAGIGCLLLGLGAAGWGWRYVRRPPASIV
jgi:Tol biopolymer transport system component